MSASLLLVEDDAGMALMTRRFLQQAGHRVTVAGSAEEALVLIQKNRPDLVLSDIHLPGLSGLKLCEIIKGTPATASLPFILVTVMGKTPEKVQGLRLGADDYLAKPYDPQELVARVEAVLRRAQDPGSPAPIFRVGPLAVDPVRREVVVNGHPVELRRKEYELLLLLIRRPGRLWTRQALLSSLWGDDVVVTPNTLEVHIKNLRDRLGACGDRIETLIGEGYRLSDR